jgi:hypothetical protein
MPSTIHKSFHEAGTSLSALWRLTSRGIATLNQRDFGDTIRPKALGRPKSSSACVRSPKRVTLSMIDERHRLSAVTLGSPARLSLKAGTGLGLARSGAAHHEHTMRYPSLASSLVGLWIFLVGMISIFAPPESPPLDRTLQRNLGQDPSIPEPADTVAPKWLPPITPIIRVSDDPILRPKGTGWESAGVFNPTAGTILLNQLTEWFCLSPLLMHSFCILHQVTWCAPLAAIDNIPNSKASYTTLARGSAVRGGVRGHLPRAGRPGPVQPGAR